MNKPNIPTLPTNNTRILHPCIHAQGNRGGDAYRCELTCVNCTAQFFCHNERYWRPSIQIKCPDFISKEQAKK